MELLLIAFLFCGNGLQKDSERFAIVTLNGIVKKCDISPKKDPLACYTGANIPLILHSINGSDITISNNDKILQCKFSFDGNILYYFTVNSFSNSITARSYTIDSKRHDLLYSSQDELVDLVDARDSWAILTRTGGLVSKSLTLNSLGLKKINEYGPFSSVYSFLNQGLLVNVLVGYERLCVISDGMLTVVKLSDLDILKDNPIVSCGISGTHCHFLCKDGSVVSYDAKVGHVIARCKLAEKVIEDCAALSRTGKYLACFSSGKLSIYQLNGNILQLLSSYDVSRQVTCNVISLSENGKYVIAGGENRVTENGFLCIVSPTGKR